MKKLPHVLWDKMCQISLVSQQNMQNLWKIFAFFPPIFFFTWPGVNYSLSTNLQQLAWQCMYMYVSGQNIVSIFWWQTVHCHDIWWSSHIRNIFNIFFMKNWSWQFHTPINGKLLLTGDKLLVKPMVFIKWGRRIDLKLDPIHLVFAHYKGR